MTPSAHSQIAANVAWLAEVDSTNEVVARLVASWAEDDDDRLGDTLVVAERQSAGRGRGDHVWSSPPGGLYATWLGWITTVNLRWLPIAAGVCLAAAVEEAMPGIAAGLKWPNDVLVGGRKLGGVLCHSRTRGDLSWAAVGFGVNVGVVPETAAGAGAGATCLRGLGLAGATDAAIWTIAESFVRGLRPALASSRSLAPAWLARTVHHRGDMLRVRKGDEVLVGAFVGLGAGGELDVEVAGTLHHISAGELIGALPEAKAED